MSDSEDALRDQDWQSLASAIIGQQCILMLGPQAITADFDGEQLPVLDGLTRHIKRKLTDEVDEKYVALDQSDPASVAQAASEAVKDLFTIESWAKQFFRDLEGEGEALAELAELPFELIVNTSPGAVR